MKKILYVGPLKDISGYAEASRNYARALTRSGADVVVRPLVYDGGSIEFDAELATLYLKPASGVDVVVQHTTPNETERKDGVFNVNCISWETDRMPSEWVNKLNRMDLVIVSCEANVLAAKKSGVYVPVEYVPLCMNPPEVAAPYAVDGFESHFKILAVCQDSKKKGIDVLLKSFFAEFRKTDKVLLILKTYANTVSNKEYKEKLFFQVDKMKEALRMNDYAHVMLLPEVYSKAQMNRLYSTADLFCLPSRGEGWGLPYMEAMHRGTPVIATNWGGPTHFIDDSCGWLIPQNPSPCIDMPHPHSFMYTGSDMWAEPVTSKVMEAMRAAYNEWKIYKFSGNKHCKWSDRKRKCIEKMSEFSVEGVGKTLLSVIEKHYRAGV